MAHFKFGTALAGTVAAVAIALSSAAAAEQNRRGALFAGAPAAAFGPDADKATRALSEVLGAAPTAVQGAPAGVSAGVPASVYFAAPGNSVIPSVPGGLGAVQSKGFAGASLYGNSHIVFGNPVPSTPVYTGRWVASHPRFVGHFGGVSAGGGFPYTPFGPAAYAVAGAPIYNRPVAALGWPTIAYGAPAYIAYPELSGGRMGVGDYDWPLMAQAAVPAQIFAAGTGAAAAQPGSSATAAPVAPRPVICLVTPTNDAVLAQNNVPEGTKIAVIANTEPACAAIGGTVAGPQKTAGTR